ncbi:hypothetical protein AB4Y63_03795 [Leifsonia sp. YAF41]|jgi:hypothetical protein
MPDKSPHHHNDKKHGLTIKQKRAAKREKAHPSEEDVDTIAHMRKRT